MKHIPPDALRRVVEATSPFREGLLKCMPKLRQYARTLGNADDLMQATLERALKREGEYTEQGAMTAWLCQIMKNIARTQHKTERERRERFPLFCDLVADAADDNSDGDAEDYDSTVADENTFCEREAQLDAKNIIERAAKILGSEMWKCLELTAMGLTSDEIAAELGISAVAARKNVERGRKALQVLRVSSDHTEHSISKPIRKQSR